MVALFFAYMPAGHAAEAAERSMQAVRFAKGSSSVVLKGVIKGSRYVDYQLRAGAGQTLNAGLQGGSAVYFNILPPGSNDAAMFSGQLGENRFVGLLPDDGLYVLRVYQVRAAARRNESGNFSLTVSVTGKALAPLQAKVDAVIPGTPYHAKATVPCAPSYTETRQCEALVIRRGHDGTATVELRWDQAGRRRILFIKGAAVAADAQQVMSTSRDGRGDYRIVFGGDESFTVPEALLYGG